jgi:putative (di)nucleoside polyphosphate hydrolase
LALTELARFLPRVAHHNRYLRSGVRGHWRDDTPPADSVGGGIEPVTE